MTHAATPAPRAQERDLAPPALELDGVRKAYGDLEVLHGIDLVVQKGELVAVVGPSGSGKSTLLHLMGTLDRPTHGTVHIDGVRTEDLNDKALAALRSKKVGFVFQSFHLLEGMSALENVATGLLYTGTPAHRRRLRATEMLDKVGLAHRTHHNPAQLSGGERQRVAIARALLTNPAIVFADEPTGNLDTESGAEILELLQALNRTSGTTILVITHDHDVAARMNRRIDIKDGLIAHDTGTHASVGRHG